MSNDTYTQAIDAAAKALQGRAYSARRIARMAITAAMPVIREAIAQEIEALRLDPGRSTSPHCIEEYDNGLDNAAALVRGGTP